MTEKEQKKAAKEFAERWKGRGYEIMFADTSSASTIKVPFRSVPGSFSLLGLQQPILLYAVYFLITFYPYPLFEYCAHDPLHSSQA